jgi:hypothetical protein
MGCTQSTNWSNGVIIASAGTAYLDVKDNTNGAWQSICSNDFGKVLDYLSLNVSGMTDSFALAQMPSNIAQMIVEVDGVLVNYSGIDGFTYIVQDNTVKFHGDAIPGPGAIINVSYPYASVCEN